MRELRIPRKQRIHGCKTLADILQQGISLAQDVRIAQEFPVVGGTCLRELRIQIASPQCRRTLDEKEILGREEHHWKNPDEIALPEMFPCVRNAPPCAAGKRKGKLPRNILPQEGKPDVRPVFAHANKLRIARCAMGAAERSIVQRLDNIRLALRIRPEKDLHPRVKVEGELLVVAVGTQYK